MFHSGKMTTGTGLPDDHGFDTHKTNEQCDIEKFNAIKNVAQNEEKFKKAKIWLTHMCLNREMGDRFDCFDAQVQILVASNIYTMKAIISEADVLQFHGATNDNFCFYDFDELGHQPGCISITQDLENFFCAFLQKNRPKEFAALLNNDLNMFHFEKLLEWQTFVQKHWLKRKMKYLQECIGNRAKTINGHFACFTLHLHFSYFYVPEKGVT